MSGALLKYLLAWACWEEECERRRERESESGEGEGSLAAGSPASPWLQRLDTYLYILPTAVHTFTLLCSG